MAETTRGGHWRDTDGGDGPALLDPPVGRGAEPLPHLAFSVYLTHVRGCTECQHRLYNCPEGKLLWAAYTAARDAA